MFSQKKNSKYYKLMHLFTIIVMFFSLVTPAFASEQPLDEQPIGSPEVEQDSSISINVADSQENNTSDEEFTTEDSLVVELEKSINIKEPIEIPEGAIPGEIIVKYSGNAMESFSISSEHENADEFNIASIEEINDDTQLITLEDAEQASEVIAQLQEDPRVEYAEFNMEYEVFDVDQPSNDTYVSQQWALTSANFPAGWTNDVQNGSVTVAVIDTGVDAAHPDLQDRVLTDQGENFVDTTSDGEAYDPNWGVKDDNGHGTSVTGVINAIYNNSMGITGAAGPANVKVLPVKVMNERGTGSTFDIAEGIQYAVSQGADIINLSLGGNYSQVIYDAVMEAEENGVLVVAAAGNSAANVNQFYPAAIPGVLTVGAISAPVGSKAEVVADFSNYGDALEIVAPGEDIMTTTTTSMLGNPETGYYREVSGTSFSAPYAAAAAALYMLKNPDKSATDTFYAITSTAKDLGAKGKDPLYGEGKLNVQTLLGEDIVVEKPTILFTYPTENSHMAGDAQIKVQVFDDTIYKVDYYINEVAEENLIASAKVENDFTAHWDTRKHDDGAYTLIAVAYSGKVENGTTSIPIWIQNNPESGLMLKVLNPEGNVAPNAEIHIFHKAKVVSEEHLKEGMTEAYQLLWEGYTDLSGIARIPSTEISDLDTLYVLIQGSFDRANTENGKAFFYYHEIIEEPGLYTINGDDSVEVQLSATNNQGKALKNAQYFAAWLDDENKTIGITAPFSEEEMTSPIIYMDKGNNNLFVYQKQDNETYFLGKWRETIDASKSILFDGKEAGKVQLEFDESQADIVDGSMYFYNSTTDEALGIGNVLTGRAIYVTPGVYDFWADVEVKDKNGGENWIYALGTEKWNPNLTTINSGETAKIKMGGKLQLTDFSPDIDELKLQSKKMGIDYIQEENPYEVEKSMKYFYTKQKFADAYGNMLWGMYRGSLNGAELTFKQQASTANSNVLALNNSDSWEKADFYFGDIFPYFKVTKSGTTDKPIYNNSFQLFYSSAFWFIDRDIVPAGNYDLEISLIDNPLSGEKISNTIVNTVKDSRSYSQVEVQIDGERVLPNQVSIYTSTEDDSGSATWELVTTGTRITTKTDPDYGLVKYPSNLKLSTKKNGNLYRVIYIRPDGEYVLVMGQFTTLDEIQTIDLNTLQRVEFSAVDENGKPLQAKMRERSIIYPAVVEGKDVFYIQITGKGYAKDAVWLPAGQYHFDGNFITVPDEKNRTTNYYLIKPNVQINEGQTNKIVFDAQGSAKISLDAKYNGYSDFRGAVLLPYNRYRSVLKEEDMVGHDFFVPSNLELDLVAYIGLGDQENQDYVWNYFVKNHKKTTFAPNEQLNWQVAGQFKANIALENKDSIAQTQKLIGTSGITDEFDNPLVMMLIEDNSRFAALDDRKVTKLFKLNNNGKLSAVTSDDEWDIQHDFSDPELLFDEGIYPYLRVYKQDTNQTETRIFNESKADYFTSFTEQLQSLTPGKYRAELAYAAGPNSPISSSDLFSIAGGDDSDDNDNENGNNGGSGGSGGSVTHQNDGVKDAVWKQAIENGKTAEKIIVEGNGVNPNQLVLSSSQIAELKQAGKPLELQLQNSTLLIPVDVLGNNLPKDAKNVEFMAQPIDKNQANSYVEKAENAAMIQIAGAVYELSIQATLANGEKQYISSFSAPVQVTLPVPAAYLEEGKEGSLRAHRYNPETNRWDDLGGAFDNDRNMLVFETRQFSKYALFVVEDEVMSIFEFGDITNHWAQQDILDMAEKGLVAGIDENHFKPNTPITRAQFAALLSRVLDLPHVDSEKIFNDVNVNHWAFADIAAANKAGIVAGYEHNSFMPNAKITREEMIAMIIRALEYANKINQSETIDVDKILKDYQDYRQISNWSKENLAFAVKEGIAVGANHKLLPKSNASRAEAVVLLKRVMERR